jgi:hypothetical protein
MKFFRIAIFIIAVYCFSCGDKKPIEKNKSQLRLTKNNRAAFDANSVYQGDSINVEMASVKADEYYFEGDSALWVAKNLIGCWFIPHNAIVHILFKKDGTFEFNDYNSKSQKDEILTGRFDINAKEDRLTLLYNNRPKQRFSFKPGEYPDDNYYIRNAAGYYFVKGICQ